MFNKWWLFLTLSVGGCAVADQHPDPAGALACPANGVWLQVLGSGGPEIDDGRQSASYLIWDNGRASVLIDAGDGAAAQFDRVGGDFTELDAILITHWHVDHSIDLATFVKGSYFTTRKSKLIVIGPGGNRLVPSTEIFVQRLLGASQGAYAYLGDFLQSDPRPSGFKIEAINYRQSVQFSSRIKADAVAVDHGPIPALAWRLELNGRRVVISGDMAGADDQFTEWLAGTDLFVAHHAIPERAGTIARRLHMPPSLIAKYASEANVGRLLLGHRMKRTIGREAESLRIIRHQYSGPVEFAEDLACVALD